MQVIPAIDLLEGRCVRLKQGDYAKEITFSNDPVAVARQWVAEGATQLHLVDLDGAKEGHPVNGDVIAHIVEEVKIPCELGGGIRSQEAIEHALELGVARVIVGTRAVRDPGWFAQMAHQFPGKLSLGLDAKNGMVAMDGWLRVSAVPALELAQAYNDLPLATVVYTDIARDGMLEGPNFDAIVAVMRASAHPVVASGGVTTAKDVLELRERGIGACILGRSLYEGTINLVELLQMLKEEL